MQSHAIDLPSLYLNILFGPVWGMCQHLTPPNKLSSSCPGSLALALGRKRPWERGYLNNVISHQSSRHYVVSCITKMALCHYPCPEEIDVFTGPHMRMKQLVYEALEKVSSWSLEERVFVSLRTVVTHERAERSSHSPANLQRWFRFWFEKRLAISATVWSRKTRYLTWLTFETI